MTYLAWFIFIAAAVLEVGGDAVVRKGLRGNGFIIIMIGFAMLGCYGVVVNMVIRPEVGEAAPDFVRNRIEMQSGYLDEIGERFPGQVRAVVPLFDSDIRGVPSIARASGAIFG